MADLRLIPINKRGKPALPVENLPEIVTEIGKAQVDLYKAEGFVLPWVGYLAVDEDLCVGCCGFKSPPKEGRVEIAYFTFPPFEGKRYATRMAEQLVEIAEAADPDVQVIAQTLPDESPSTAILRRLNFELVGTVEHPDDGPVWEWHRRRPIA
jgi:ribosomal-protein-alanine N-acetyltransferase